MQPEIENIVAFTVPYLVPVSGNRAHQQNIIRGSKTKLTVENVEEIRFANVEDYGSFAKLDQHFAEKFGVWRSTIYFARRGTTWWF